jgi:hypothetical protein
MPRTDRTERASRSATRDSPYALRAANTTVTASPYTPIDSENGEIRLLELAPGKFQDDIEICLVPANLNDDPSTQYEALSYVWGTELCSRRARLNGIPVTITQNLDCAIRHLRMKVVTRLLWIDALSMNQQNTQERNHQVQIMGEIYSTASGVIVWLGPVEQSDIHMRAILGAMQFHFSDSNSAVTSLFDYVCSVVGLMNEQVANPMEPRECVLDTLFRIIDRPWFGRMWVVQELALSKTATIRIGPFSVPWIPFQQFFQWLPHHKADPKTRTVLVSACSRVFKVASSDHFDSQLRRTLHLAATDPRDKVYSILGISVLSEAPIKPDYGKSTRMVYSEAVACLLREKRMMLYFATSLQPAKRRSISDKPAHFPSWVPDLSVWTGDGTETTENVVSHQSPMDILYTKKLAPLGAWSLQQILLAMCHRFRFPLARFSCDLSTLFAPGVLISTITETSADLMDHVEDFSSHAYIPRQVCDFYHSTLKPRGIQPSRLFNTLFHINHGAPDLPEMECLCMLLDHPHQTIVTTSMRIRIKDLCDIIRAKARKRMLFVTNKEHVGISYHPDYGHGIRTGDIVVGLFGVNFPFILRRNEDDTYQMINVAGIADVEWGHSFLHNVVYDGASFSRGRKWRGGDPQPHTVGASWKDYEQHGMKEYAIV